ncbi:IS200/IS605 family transposase [Kitasatospora sp. NPDC058048]|uniref:IS200/IS605 family transposase n=1 Tax=Kitasatospora sp. NPDC058048 TaxID=3346313 RepID=UPI0036D9EAE0
MRGLRGRVESVDCEPDHVHLLVHYPPEIQLSKLVDSLKGVSSRRLRQDYDSHVRRYLRGGGFWSGTRCAVRSPGRVEPGPGASTGRSGIRPEVRTVRERSVNCSPVG